MSKYIAPFITYQDYKCKHCHRFPVDFYSENGGFTGKINKCKKRLVREWYHKLMKDPKVDTIPAYEEDFIKLVTSRPDYKNRKKREENEI